MSKACPQREITIKTSTIKTGFFVLFVTIIVLVLFTHFSSRFNAGEQTNNLLAIFLTGLFVGGLTCMAVQGGLLAATIAQREEERLKEKVKHDTTLPILAFITAKLAAYTLLGVLLGLLGQAFQLSLTTRTILDFAVVIFMVGTALNILEVHPIFRYFVIQPPKVLTRLVRKQSKSKDVFAPALLGAFTVFIPCGTTQAMMALAIASGNALTGATILFAFILGTSPLFFILGYLATKLGDTMQQKFIRFAAFAIILLAVFNLNNAIALTGSHYTLNNILDDVGCTLSICTKPSTISPNTVQAATITINSAGYAPNELSVKAGTKIKLHIINIDGQGCTQTFTIPSLGIQQTVPIGNQADIAFTAPSQAGQLPFMCSMGMYRGMINII